MADGVRFTVWALLPVLLAAAVSVLSLGAAADAASFRGWAIACAVVLGVVLVAKAFRDYRWGRSLDRARYDAMRELHNTVGPALDMMTELATMDPSETATRRAQLEKIADLFCGALVKMTPQSTDVRAVVFALRADPDRLEAIGRFGRNDVPRTFLLADPAGDEIMTFLRADPPLGAELYPDIRKRAPEGYEGRRDRYRTFIRVPIWSNGALFGMLVVDSPKRKSLVDGDKLLAGLVAAELATAFAVAAAGGTDEVSE